MPFTQRVRIVVDIARALAAAHQLKVVHRDVKPDNVMVRDDGRVVVLDFGIAKRPPGSTADSASASMSAMTGPGMVMGTPAYLSPEQIQGTELDGRADQFALAVTAYEFITGQLPCATPTRRAACARGFRRRSTT